MDSDSQRQTTVPLPYLVGRSGRWQDRPFPYSLKAVTNISRRNVRNTSCQEAAHFFSPVVQCTIVGPWSDNALRRETLALRDETMK